MAATGYGQLPRTYSIDNQPIDFDIQNDLSICLRQPAGPKTANIEKEINVTLDPQGAADFSGRTPKREKYETGCRRRLDSNSRLPFARRSRFIGPQSTHFACLRQTESPKPKNRADCTAQDRQCEPNVSSLLQSVRLLG